MSASGNSRASNHEVLATVDIDQADLAVSLDHRSHQCDGQRALSAKHQWCLIG
jgi:hypothetical protein